MTKNYENPYKDFIWGIDEWPPEAPSLEQLQLWELEGGCETIVCGCWVEPDGVCGEHNRPSWLLALGLI